MAQRFDRGELRPARKRADGTARYDAYLTRSGVFSYRQPDGSVLREYRDPAEVFKADSLSTLELVPLTNDHPIDMVSIADATRLAVGAVGDAIKRDGNKVRATISVIDAAAIASIAAGKVQLSCGYTCDMLDGAGVSPDGEPYDTRQTNIEYNHVALVAAGRAGPDIRIRSDAAEQLDDADKNPTPKDGHSMELQEALAAAAKANTRADQSDAALLVAKATADKLAGELDATKAKLITADKGRLDAVESIAARVSARVALETRTKAVLPDAKLDGLSDRAVMCLVIKQLNKADVAADKSDEYVVGRYEAIMDGAAVGDAVLESLQKQITQGHKDGAINSEATAQAAMIKANREIYKGKA
jgi:hypothetical protein